MMKKIKRAMQLVIFLTPLSLSIMSCYAAGPTQQAPLTVNTSDSELNAINGIHTGNNAGVYGEHGRSGSKNFGYLGGNIYGAKGENKSGSFGFLGDSDKGAGGQHKSGNYGYLGSSTYGVRGTGRGNSIGGYFSSASGYGLIVAKGNVGIGTTAPVSELQVVGKGEVAELTISPDGDNETSKLVMCQDKECDDASIFRYDGDLNSLYLYFKNSRGSGFGEDRDRIAFKIEHHANSDARIGINVPKEHDVRSELEVAGTIRAEEIIVESGWADFVFNQNYKLMDLSTVEQFIQSKHHLPGIPNTQEITSKGISVGEFQVKLLQKVEELTLYLIDQQREIASLKKELHSLRSN